MLFTRFAAVFSLLSSAVLAAPGTPSTEASLEKRLDISTSANIQTFDLPILNFGNLADICFYQGANVFGLTGESICICVFPKNFLDVQVIISTDAYVPGVDVSSVLTLNHGSGCNVPEFATPKFIAGYAGFTIGSQADCCDFVCNSGYVRCSGQCYKGTKCPSGKVWNHRREIAAGSVAGGCPADHTACAVPGLHGKKSYECLNTRTNMESCGGCLHGGADNTTALGQDCTSIPGANEVSCNAGSCLIHSCMPGYTLASNGRSCRATMVLQKYRL